MSDEDRDIGIPSFHPRRQVADNSPLSRFLLRDNEISFGGRIARDAERKGGGGAGAVPRGIERVREERIKVNELTSNDPLLYLRGDRW